MINMRKIYPSPFNKFAAFVLYTLLSIATITLAQGIEDKCGSNINVDGEKLKSLNIIGYAQPSMTSLQIDNTNWSVYSFINVIVNNTNPQSPIITNQLNGFVGKVRPKIIDTNTKILLSIRNYDDLPKPSDVNTIIRDYNLDGVDITHPEKMGCFLGSNFGTFLVDLRRGMKQPPNKTIMLTVDGQQINPESPNYSFGSTNLNQYTQNVDYLNVETYHYSLTKNMGTQNPKSYPNAPYNSEDGFKSGLDNSKRLGFGKKIIMGIDFGNTIQIVNSSQITEQEVVVIQNSPYDIKSNSNLPREILDNLTEIPVPSNCNGGNNIKLFSWPWKNFSSYVLDPSKNYCETKGDNWIRKFDGTPWLYKQHESGNGYYYVSYEDPYSLSTKLQYVIGNLNLDVGNVGNGGFGESGGNAGNGNRIVGISISDVTYDDENNTFLKFIRNGTLLISNGSSPSNPTSPKSPTKNPGNTSNPSISPNEQNTNPAVIAGGVIGGLVGLIILTASCVSYRKRHLLKSKDVRAIPKGPIGTHNTTSKIAEPSPNRSTTVIPVASGYVTAMFDFNGEEENDLSFKKGDKIEVLERGDGPNDWWVGRVNGVVGEFPGNYVKDVKET